MLNNRGRPKKDDSLNRVVVTRLDENDDAILKYLCETYDLSRSDIMRKSLELMAKLCENGYKL